MIGSWCSALCSTSQSRICWKYGNDLLDSPAGMVKIRGTKPASSSKSCTGLLKSRPTSASVTIKTRCQNPNDCRVCGKLYNPPHSITAREVIVPRCMVTISRGNEADERYPCDSAQATTW